MSIADLEDVELRHLLMDMRKHTADGVKSEIAPKYGVIIPQWLTIKYKCVSCAKETRSKVQSINIQKINGELTCPFCRKMSKIYNIHIEKEFTLINPMENNPSEFL